MKGAFIINQASVVTSAEFIDSSITATAWTEFVEFIGPQFEQVVCTIRAASEIEIFVHVRVRHVRRYMLVMVAMNRVLIVAGAADGITQTQAVAVAAEGRGGVAARVGMNSVLRVLRPRGTRRRESSA